MSGNTGEAALKEAFTFNHTQSNRCGCTLSASVEGNAIGRVMSRKPGVRVTYYPALVRVDGDESVEEAVNHAQDFALVEPAASPLPPLLERFALGVHAGRRVAEPAGV